jgi:hypothetical protein
MKKSNFPRILHIPFYVFLLFTIAGCAIPAIPGVLPLTPEGEIGLTPGDGTIPNTGGSIPAPRHTPLTPASPSREPDSTSTPPPAAATLAPISQASASPLPPTPLPYVRPAYDLDVTINYPAKKVDVVQQITFENTTGESLKTLLLAVEPNLTDGVFILKNLKINDKTTDEYKLDGQKFEIHLKTPLENGKTIKIGLTYHITMPLIVASDPNLVRPQIFGYTTRQINLVDWYPFIVPYRPGAGWILHKPWFYGEHLVYNLADFKVTVRFTGTEPGNDPLVAASGWAEPDLGITHYYLENGRTFALSISDQFKVASQQIGDVTVSSYYFNDLYAASGQATLAATVRAVKTYTELFGAYPHKTLAVAQGDFKDAMEYDGLYFLSNSYYDLYNDSEESDLVRVAAHETCHQWWFGRVGNDQAQEPWLDEALSMYCEKLFYEKNYPAEVAWWWTYRVDYYQPQGYIDLPVQDYGGFNPYENAVYRMGAHFLNDLRQQIGDEAFFAFLKDYSTRMNGKTATTADFFRILRKHTNADISALISTYFKTPR